ncbi:MAG: LacI family DNA-binding transcriptional regulator [Clostridia bacterium]
MFNSVRPMTIKKIAEQAGVSVSTVSRVLNNPESVRTDKRQRVELAIKATNYIPSPIAKALGMQKSKTIGILVPNIINDCSAKIVSAIMEELDMHDFDTLLFNTIETLEKEEHITKLVREKMVDGIIMISSLGTKEEIAELANVMPVVLIDRQQIVPNLDAFLVDGALGMLKLVGYLKDLGHAKFGLLAGDLQTDSCKLRVQYFKAALFKEGLELDPLAIAYSSWEMRGGYQAMARLLEKKLELTAIIASSDVLAIGGARAAYIYGRKIPEDLSLVGFDNFSTGEFMVPALTTLKYPAAILGKLAAKSILQRLNDRNKPGIEKMLPMELLIRESAGTIK